MTEDVPCDDCGTTANFKEVHRHETADEKQINFCETCCPNCFGGKGNDRYVTTTNSS